MKRDLLHRRISSHIQQQGYHYQQIKQSDKLIHETDKSPRLACFAFLKKRGDHSKLCTVWMYISQCSLNPQLGQHMSQHMLCAKCRRALLCHSFFGGGGEASVWMGRWAGCAAPTFSQVKTQTTPYMLVSYSWKLCGEGFKKVSYPLLTCRGAPEEVWCVRECEGLRKWVLIGWFSWMCESYFSTSVMINYPKDLSVWGTLSLVCYHPGLLLNWLLMQSSQKRVEYQYE